MATISIGPLTRIEGHLDFEADLDGGRVTAARSSGTMFRGFELLLRGRSPLDAPNYTQRICGVCPISHGMASCMALESAFGVKPADNGRILRNLILGSNFIASHVLHFYHLAALDYVDTTGLLNVPPWTPRYVTSDMIRGKTASHLVAHYVEALAIRRKAHEMGAIFGGKLPCSASLVPGGCSSELTPEKIGQFRKLLAEITAFLREKHVPDIEMIGKALPDYWEIGRGTGNLLAFGAFELDNGGGKKFLPGGRCADGKVEPVDVAQIAEYVKFSRYAESTTGLAPAKGQTSPEPEKTQAYSWIKAPRYAKQPYELGPLARMWISGDHRRGISVLDRLMARAVEARKIATAMSGWLDELDPSSPTRTSFQIPGRASGVGLTEAPRGALGHWVDVAGGQIGRYQVVTPTAWNASPRDDFDQPGPIEQALAGVRVADPAQPVELLRIVHSFDPCLACSVHTLQAGVRR